MKFPGTTRSRVGIVILAVVSVLLLWYLSKDLQSTTSVGPPVVSTNVATKDNLAEVQKNTTTVEHQVQDLTQKAIGIQSAVESLKSDVSMLKNKEATPAPAVVVTQPPQAAAPKPPPPKPAPPVKKATPAKPKVAVVKPLPVIRRPASAPPVRLANPLVSVRPLMSDGWTSGTVLFDQVRCQLGRKPENPNNCK